MRFLLRHRCFAFLFLLLLQPNLGAAESLSEHGLILPATPSLMRVQTHPAQRLQRQPLLPYQPAPQGPVGMRAAGGMCRTAKSAGWCPGVWCKSGVPQRVAPPCQPETKGRMMLRSWSGGAMVSRIM